ncbi:prolyl oligopeptidase family serine peptidase [Aquimarina sp. 2-A2]|uniref:prolyl oligopeptidase family serine peptidase n=1 Tax=Aquimarina sp. 2-A2 TaxID=3382644 RepID=UPI00387F0863
MSIKLLKLFLLIICISCKSEEHSQSLLIKVDQSVSDTIHGTVINDPFRYFENSEDSTVLNWYKEEKKYSDSLLDNISSRDELMRSIKDFNHRVSSVHSDIKIAGKDENISFFLKNLPSKNIKALYKIDAKNHEKIIFNPLIYNSKSKDVYVINYYKPSWDGNNVVVSLTKNDEEISELIVIDAKTNEVISSVLKNCWPSALGGISWLPDSSGFTYQHIPNSDINSINYLLDIETLLYDIKTDTTKIIFSRKNNPEIKIEEEDFPNISFESINSKYVLASVSGASNYVDYYYTSLKDFKLNQIEWKILFKKDDLIRDFLIYEDEIIYLSSKNSSNFKILKSPIKNLHQSKVLVEEDNYVVISDIALTQQGLFYVKTKNGVEATLYRLINEKEVAIELPKKFGHIDLMNTGSNAKRLWLETEGWTTIKKRYNFNFENNALEEEKISDVGNINFLNDVIIEEIEVSSIDGKLIPLSIIYNKDLKRNGTSSLLINAYGAFKWSNSPYLYPYLYHWVKNGGVYATAHVRGGGEKGDDWHKGGFKESKPNSWKDLITCTDYLIRQKYVSSDKTSVWGASGGGITIGRAITEKPPLFMAAVIRVGLLNMMRSEFAPNGQNLSKEFGAIKDSLESKFLYEMDAYHHLKKRTSYPAVLLTAGLNDSRVAVWQTTKFAAKMKVSTMSKKPVLLNVDFEGGHGFDSVEDKKNKELLDIMTFLFWQTGHPDYQPKKD